MEKGQVRLPEGKLTSRLELLDAQGCWQGSASELLKALEERVDDQAKRQHGWSKNPRSLSGHLKRLSPNLRAAPEQTTTNLEEGEF